MPLPRLTIAEVHACAAEVWKTSLYLLPEFTPTTGMDLRTRTLLFRQQPQQCEDREMVPLLQRETPMGHQVV